jgi:hypothetical protein
MSVDKQRLRAELEEMSDQLFGLCVDIINDDDEEEVRDVLNVMNEALAKIHAAVVKVTEHQEATVSAKQRRLANLPASAFVILQDACKICDTCARFDKCRTSSYYLICKDLSERLVSEGIDPADVPELIAKYNNCACIATTRLAGRGFTIDEWTALKDACKICDDCENFYTCDNTAYYLECKELAKRLESNGIAKADIPDLLERYNDWGDEC